MIGSKMGCLTPTALENIDNKGCQRELIFAAPKLLGILLEEEGLVWQA
jgi:hypothetical protein